MTILADVVAQERKTAVDHRLYSTTTCAGVYAHEGSHAQMAKYSVSGNVTVFVPLNDLVVHLSVSIQKHAAVSVQNQDPHVLMHRDLKAHLVYVNVQTGQQNVPLGKSLIKLDAGVDALEF